MRIALVICSFLAACGGTVVDRDPFNTIQDCFDEHAKTEGLTVPHAITTCCLDHPISGNVANVVCGATQTQCESFLHDNLAATDATTGEITAACADYINQR